MNDPAYPVNFAIQAVVISAFALGMAACLRRPERRAGAALVGLLACGVIPFFSAFAPVKERAKETMLRNRVIQIEPLPMVETIFHPVLLEQMPDSSAPAKPDASPIPKLNPVTWVLLAWLAGSLASGLLMARELIRTRRWWVALVCPDEAEWEKLRRVLPQGFSRDRIRISADASGPCVIGFLNPRIVIPKWLLETNFRRELDWTLRHEMEHLRCHDSRWIHVIRAIRIVQWWNPPLHLLAGAWSQAREQACDLRAIRHADERPDYGHFLLKVAGGNPSRFATAMAVTNESKRLRRRIVSLLKSRSPKPSPAGIGWSLLVAGGMIVVAFLASPFGFAQTTGAASPDDDLSWLEPVPIVHLQTAAVIASEPFAAKNEILTNEQVKKRLADFAGKKGFHFQILSQGSMQRGSPLSIQLTVNRDSSVTDPPWDGSKTIDPFVGWVIHYKPQVTGNEIGLDVRAAYAFPAGNHPAPGLGLRDAPPRYFGTFSGNWSDRIRLIDGRTWDDMITATANETTTVHSGEILCTSLGEIEKGVHAVCLTGVITRMPWDYSNALEFPALAPLVPERRIDVKVVTTKQSIELTAEQKALSKRIGELRRELSKKVDSNPVNEPLLKLRTGTETELVVADPAKDKDKAAYLQWRIRRITERMQENCSADFEVDRLEIEHLANDLNSSIFKRAMENSNPDPKLNPKHFNHQEQ